MMRRRTFSGLLASAAVGALAGCEVLPQEQVEPGALRDPQGAGRAEAARAAARRMELAVLGTPAEATPIGYGFIPGSGQSYVVFDNGTARLFSAGGGLTGLERFAPRLDHVFLAGPGQRRIVGAAHRGTASSWNSANLSQQLILRPQETTFAQRRVLDMARVADAPVLAAATEGRRLELWSLVSGNLSRASEMPDGIAPRTIMPDSPRGGIVFGTETGDVRVWSGRRQTRLLHRHSARVLSLSRLGSRAILSTGQDGRAALYDRQTGQVSAAVGFDRAVYEAIVAPGGRLAMVLPTLGLPVLFDAAIAATVALTGPSGARYAAGRFSQDGRFFGARHIDGVVTLWDLSRGTGRSLRLLAPGAASPAEGSSPALGFAFAAAQGLALVADDHAVQLFDLETRRPLGTALTSEVPIAGLEATAEGDRVLVCLSDGRLLRFRPQRDAATTVPVA